MRTQLQAMRKRAGFSSAKAFAEHMGISASTYTQYEQGQRSMSLEKAWEFADVLNCTLDELAGREFHPAEERSADPFESELVDAYRSLDVRGKMHVLDDARAQRELSLKKSEGSGDVPEEMTA